MSERFHVRIAKEELIFSAAHFITYDGDTCERLHGHNYRIATEIHGPLDENHYVIDFIALRDALKALVGELDHHVLLPTQHPEIQVTTKESQVTARFQDRRWVFPAGDCVLLPVENTTAELLARFLGQRLRRELEETLSVSLTALSMEVDECAGQLGVWRWQRKSR